MLALEPEPHRLLTGAELDDALTVVADFIDLKSPYWGGHSRRCAKLAEDAAGVLGLADDGGDDAPAGGARARLRHHGRPELDLGQAGPAHAVGVRPGRASPDADRADAAPLTGACRPEPGRLRAPREMRRRRGTTSGCRLQHDHLGACVLAATEVYVGLTAERADRPPFSPDDAAADLRRLESAGVLEPRASRAVLVAAGHGEPTRANGQAAAEPGRAHAPRGRGAPARGEGPHDARDRRPPLHLTQDRRPPHPAHLRQDRRLDAGRGGSLGDAAHRGFLTKAAEPPCRWPSSAPAKVCSGTAHTSPSAGYRVDRTRRRSWPWSARAGCSWYRSSSSRSRSSGLQPGIRSEWSSRRGRVPGRCWSGGSRPHRDGIRVRVRDREYDITVRTGVEQVVRGGSSDGGDREVRHPCRLALSARATGKADRPVRGGVGADTRGQAPEDRERDLRAARPPRPELVRPSPTKMQSSPRGGRSRIPDVIEARQRVVYRHRARGLEPWCSFGSQRCRWSSLTRPDRSDMVALP